MVGNGIVLLDDGEHVQGKPAAQGNLELVHVSEPSDQHWRDEGVRAQEQENVAGVVLVIVGRGVITAGPPREADESLKRSLAQRGPFVSNARVCVAVACRDCAAQPPEDLRPARWAADARGSAAAARGVGREGARTQLEAPADSFRAGAEARESERRREDPERSGGAGGPLLTAKPVGPRWLSRIDPRRLGAALGKEERERKRGRECEAGGARSSAEIRATSPQGDSRGRLDAVRDQRPTRANLSSAPFPHLQGDAGMQPLKHELSRDEIALARDGFTERKRERERKTVDVSWWGRPQALQRIGVWETLCRRRDGKCGLQ